MNSLVKIIVKVMKIVTEQSPLIGKYLYPVDNSYSKCITDPTKKHYSLAGTYWEDAKKVLVVSEPFKHTCLNIVGEYAEHEFVSVWYEGDVYMVLNAFRETLIPHSLDFDFPGCYSII